MVAQRIWRSGLTVWVALLGLALMQPVPLEAAQQQGSNSAAPSKAKANTKASGKAKAKAKAKTKAKTKAKAAQQFTGTLRVGTTGDYPPFSWRDPATGDYLGSDIDQARSLGAALKKRVVFVPTSWSTLQADHDAGRFDIAMGGISVTPERTKRGHFSNAYLRDGKTPVARCTDVDLYQTVEQINQPAVRVIVNPGGTNERFARTNLWQSSLTVFSDNTAIFDELLEQRADVMVTDAIEGRLQQKMRPGLCAVHPDKPFDRSAKAYWLPRDKKLKQRVDRWLAASLASGSATRSLDKWLDYPWSQQVGPDSVAVRRIATLINERLSMMPDVARYKWNSGGAIEDPPREQQLLDSVRQQALQQGLPAARVTAFFAAQIEAAKVVQRELFEQWRLSGQGKFDSVVDLAAQIRPRLDSLNPQFLEALAAVPADLSRDHFPALAFTSTSAAAVATAVAPLLEHGLREPIR